MSSVKKFLESRLTHKKNQYGLEVFLDGRPSGQILMSSLPSLSHDQSYHVNHYFDETDKCLKISIHIFSSSITRLVEDLVSRHLHSILPLDHAYITVKYRESEELFKSRKHQRREETRCSGYYPSRDSRSKSSRHFTKSNHFGRGRSRSR